MQIGLMPKNVTIDTVFVIRRMQEEHHAKDLEKAFNRLPKKVLEFCNEEEMNTISIGQISDESA